MSQVTDAIEHARRQWVGSASDAPTFEELQAAAAQAREAAPHRSLAELLSADRLALIVEPKRATIARGTINPTLDAEAVARECEAAGASAISVVTEPRLSGGSFDDLRAARRGSELPLIARDFIVDARQALALRAAGADALLVPAFVHHDHEPDPDEIDHERLDRTDTLDAIVRAARGVGMEVVLSVRNDDELAFALETDVDVLNIDNRGEDGGVDVERTFELLADVPVGWPVISESIAAVDQVAKLHRAGVDALLLDEGHLETGLANALAVYADLTLDA
jgi:indole-3-glycerol phosphate synthase